MQLLRIFDEYLNAHKSHEVFRANHRFVDDMVMCPQFDTRDEFKLPEKII